LTKEGLLDAIAASGCTVWTEKNWIDASIDEQPQLWTFQDEHLTWLHAAGHSCGLFSCDEPAIHVPVKSWMHMETNCNEDSDICIDGATACSNHGHPDYIDKQENTLPLGRKCLDGWIWGCADETRILEKAQNGDAWCHAPMLNK